MQGASLDLFGLGEEPDCVNENTDGALAVADPAERKFVITDTDVEDDGDLDLTDQSETASQYLGKRKLRHKTINSVCDMKLFSEFSIQLEKRNHNLQNYLPFAEIISDSYCPEDTDIERKYHAINVSASCQHTWAERYLLEPITLYLHRDRSRKSV